MFNINVQANLPETSPFFVCPNGFDEHLFSNVYSAWMYNIGVGARLQVQKTEDLDRTPIEAKLYIPSTITIRKKILTKAVWADKKWAGFWQISLYIK